MSSKKKNTQPDTVNRKDSSVAKKTETFFPKQKVGDVKFSGTPEDGVVVSAESVNAFSQIFGCDDEDQAASMTMQCLEVLPAAEMSDAQPMLDRRSLAVSLVKDIEPTDAIERMLSVQMSATHMAVVRMAKHMARSTTLQHLEVYEAAHNRLARTFTAQMEALRKHRHGGKQTVTVQHVNVGDGGQAIVGNVHSKGGGRMEKPLSPMHASPRCHATSKRSGKRCKAPAVKGWKVCRMHGAGGGHKPGSSHPRWKDGRRSKSAMLARSDVAALLDAIKKLNEASHDAST